MCENTKKSACLCVQCEFHDREADICKVTEVTECTKQDINECKDFLVKDKLVHF